MSFLASVAGPKVHTHLSVRSISHGLAPVITIYWKGLLGGFFKRSKYHATCVGLKALQPLETTSFRKTKISRTWRFSLVGALVVPTRRATAEKQTTRARRDALCSYHH